jgi:hypothetical protein
MIALVVLMEFALSAFNLWIGSPINLWVSGFIAGLGFSILLDVFCERRDKKYGWPA